MAINTHDEMFGLDVNPLSLRETGAAAFSSRTAPGTGVSRAYAGRAVPSARPGGLAALSEYAARTFARWLERASDRRRLASLDARTLHDIGVTRAAVDYELSKPVWRA